MDIEKKLNTLADSAKFDLSCSCSNNTFSRKRDPLDPMYKWIYPAVLPNGTTLPILKILLTNYCVNQCKYCLVCKNMRSESVSFEPEELAKIFMMMLNKRLVHGLFLSSANGLDVRSTMDKILITAEILRFRYRFYGYIHLKILPGAEFSQIEKAIQFADRVSINLEAPNATHLKNIASKKNFEQLLHKIKTVGTLLQTKYGKRKSQTTQFVVGADNESDKEILITTKKLYQDYNLYRAYYSAFQTDQDLPLENIQPVPLIREHRLYQADFLFRKYGFEFNDILFDQQGNLPLDKDPKTLWAMHHPEIFPLEINKADVKQLIRVPGIGPLTAKKITTMRTKDKFHTLHELKATGLRIEQARNYILINGKFSPQPQQLEFAF